MLDRHYKPISFVRNNMPLDDFLDDYDEMLDDYFETFLENSMEPEKEVEISSPHKKRKNSLFVSNMMKFHS